MKVIQFPIKKALLVVISLVLIAQFVGITGCQTNPAGCIVRQVIMKPQPAGEGEDEWLENQKLKPIVHPPPPPPITIKPESMSQKTVEIGEGDDGGGGGEP